MIAGATAIATATPANALDTFFSSAHAAILSSH